MCVCALLDVVVVRILFDELFDLSKCKYDKGYVKRTRADNCSEKL